MWHSHVQGIPTPMDEAETAEEAERCLTEDTIAFSNGQENMITQLMRNAGALRSEVNGALLVSGGDSSAAMEYLLMGFTTEQLEGADQ